MGYIHIYTGNGKGKTTAAFGLALRSAMAGKKVYIGQFVKDMAYSETNIENYIENITIEQLGNGCFIEKKPEEKDRNIAKKALKKCFKFYKNKSYDVIILDELTIALYYNLFNVSEVLESFFNEKNNVELIITGRYCPEELIKGADLVTEMKEIKHYYNNGVESRLGIDR